MSSKDNSIISFICDTNMISISVKYVDYSFLLNHNHFYFHLEQLLFLILHTYHSFLNPLCPPILVILPLISISPIKPSDVFLTLILVKVIQ